MKACIDRPGSGPGDRERHCGAEEREDELVAVRHEEAGRKVNEKQRAEHGCGKAKCDRPGEEACDQREAADELEQGDGGAKDARGRNPHLGEAAGDAIEAEDEELLATVGGEDDSGEDAEEGEAGVDLRGRSWSEEAHLEPRSDKALDSVCEATGCGNTDRGRKVPGGVGAVGGDPSGVCSVAPANPNMRVITPIVKPRISSRRREGRHPPCTIARRQPPGGEDMRRGVLIGMTATGGAALAAVGARALGAIAWKRGTARSVERLTDRAHSARRRRVPEPDPEALAELPDPVKRYFAFALRPGHRFVESARSIQQGEFAIKPGQWQPFTATQHVTVRPPGFVWDATIRMGPGVSMRVRDSYIGGVGRMHGRFAGLIPVVDQSGTAEMASGSLHRCLAEAPWIPTALLPAAGVTWTPIDDMRSRATISDFGTTVSVDFEFNDRGEISAMSAERFRDVGGTAVLTPWVGQFRNYRDVGGMMVPEDGEVAWVPSTGAEPYWRGRVTEVAYSHE